MVVTLRRATAPTAVPVPAPRYRVRPRPEQADRADLTCTTCTRTIAYALPVDRVPADSGFFLEMHRPFCMRR